MTSFILEHIAETPDIRRGRRKATGSLEALICVRPGAWVTYDGFFSIDRMPVASEYGPGGTWLVIANNEHPTRDEYVEWDTSTFCEARKRLAELRREDLSTNDAKR